MISTMLPKTAQTPFGSVMPISGAISGAWNGMAAGAARVTAYPTYGFVVRDRHVAGVTLAQGAVPGPTAWSPPIS